MIGRRIKDAYKGDIRTGTVIEDLGSHWQVKWDGRPRTKIRKDRVGKRPKKTGPWWAEVWVSEDAICTDDLFTEFFEILDSELSDPDGAQSWQDGPRRLVLARAIRQLARCPGEAERVALALEELNGDA